MCLAQRLNIEVLNTHGLIFGYSCLKSQDILEGGENLP